MPKGKRYSPEQIITKLREAEILLSQGKSVDEIARALDTLQRVFTPHHRSHCAPC